MDIAPFAICRDVLSVTSALELRTEVRQVLAGNRCLLSARVDRFGNLRRANLSQHAHERDTRGVRQIQITLPSDSANRVFNLEPSHEYRVQFATGRNSVGDALRFGARKISLIEVLLHSTTWLVKWYHFDH